MTRGKRSRSGRRASGRAALASRLAALVRQSVADPEHGSPMPPARLGSAESTSPKPDADQKASKVLTLVVQKGETMDGVRAKSALRPTIRAASTIATFDRVLGDLDLTTLVGKLAEQVSAVQRGDLSRAEEMLIAQAHTLDLLFHQLIQRSVGNTNAGHLEAADMFMRLGLRTQSQCRATLETLSVVKNPPSVALVRQANIAHGPQQVNNNGAPAPNVAEPARTREIQPNKLLEERNDRVDAGAAQETVRANSGVEPMGPVNRTEQPGRKGEGGQERL